MATMPQSPAPLQLQPIASAPTDETDSFANTRIEVDLSAASYSSKKSAELQRIFHPSSTTNKSSVAQIIAQLDERGIGRVSLDGVQVEAFVHKMQKEEKLPAGNEAFEFAVALARDNKDKDNDERDYNYNNNKNHVARGSGSNKKMSAEGGNATDEAGSGGAGGGAPSKSLENYLQKAFETARGIHIHNEDNGQALLADTDHVVFGDEYDNEAMKRRAAEGRREMVLGESEDTQAGRSSIPSKNTAGRGKAAGKISDTSGAARKGRAEEAGDSSASAQEYEQRLRQKLNDAKSEKQPTNRTVQAGLDVHRKFDASNTGADEVHAKAYSMNAAKNVPRSQRKLLNAGQGYGDEVDKLLAPQKGLDKVVASMADARNNLPELSKEAVNEPDRDTPADNFEKRMQAKLNNARRENVAKKGVVRVPSSSLVGGEEKTPGGFSDKMRKKRTSSSKASKKGEDGVGVYTETIMPATRDGRGVEDAGEIDRSESSNFAGLKSRTASASTTGGIGTRSRPQDDMVAATSLEAAQRMGMNEQNHNSGKNDHSDGEETDSSYLGDVTALHHEEDSASNGGPEADNDLDGAEVMTALQEQEGHDSAQEEAETNLEGVIQQNDELDAEAKMKEQEHLMAEEEAQAKKAEEEANAEFEKQERLAAEEEAKRQADIEAEQKRLAAEQDAQESQSKEEEEEEIEIISEAVVTEKVSEKSPNPPPIPEPSKMNAEINAQAKGGCCVIL